MRLNEHKLQNRLLVALSKIPGCLCWRHTVGTFRAYGEPEKIVKVGTPGQADVFCVYQGKFFSIELKAEKGRKREGQERWAKAVTRCGGTHIWACLKGGPDLDYEIDATIREVLLVLKSNGPGAEASSPQCHPTDRSETLGATP